MGLNLESKMTERASRWIIVIASVETMVLSLIQTAYINFDGFMIYETGLFVWRVLD